MYRLVINLLLLCFLFCANGFIGRAPGRILFRNVDNNFSKLGSLGAKKETKWLDENETPEEASKESSTSKIEKPQDELPDLDTLLNSLRNLLPDGETYSLRKITEWLAANGTLRSDYVYSESGISRSIYHTEIRLTLNKDLKLSIQTEPCTAGDAFCETALAGKHGLISDAKLGYGDTVCRWNEPEDLFQHIVEIRQQLEDKQDKETPDGEADVHL